MIKETDVKHIASLARIHLTEEGVQHFTKDLENILHYVEKLTALNVSKVEPTSHVLSLQNIFREDVAGRPLSQEEALKFSIEKHNGQFKVPKVIE